MKNRRKKAKRNFWSYFERRKSGKGGYPKESVCSECGRAIVEEGRLCDDCKKEKGF